MAESADAEAAVREDLKRSVSELMSHVATLQKTFAILMEITRKVMDDSATRTLRAEQQVLDLRGTVSSLEHELLILRSRYEERGEEVVRLSQELWTLACRLQPDPAATSSEQSDKKKSANID